MPDQRTVARLPEAARGAFEDPLGPVYADTESLLADAGDPLVAVGDVVTHHLLAAGRRPDLAVVDERTEREPVDAAVAASLATLGPPVEVANAPATLSAALVGEVAAGIRREDPAAVLVEGEEDLATLAAVLLAPDGAAVVYGQPGEGMVLVAVDDAARERTRQLAGRLETDARFWELVGASPP